MLSPRLNKGKNWKISLVVLIKFDQILNVSLNTIYWILILYIDIGARYIDNQMWELFHYIIGIRTEKSQRIITVHCRGICLFIFLFIYLFIFYYRAVCCCEKEKLFKNSHANLRLEYYGIAFCCSVFFSY